MSKVPSLREFRHKVDHILDPRTALLTKSIYLTAARGSEVTTHIDPYDKEHNRVRLPYGTYVKCHMDTFDHEELRHKVLVIEMPIAKRKLKTTKTKTEEQKLKLIFKPIALPCDPKYEPWTEDLINYIRKRGTLSFDLCRTRIRQLIIESFHRLDLDVTTHWLRHARLTHLSDFYKFDAEDLILMAGWTYQGAMGIRTGQLDRYVHSHWTRYFPKLLKPL